MTDAKKFFADNITRLGQPETDPQAWNLNGGLHQLAMDLEENRGLLKKIQQQLADLARRLPPR